MGVNTFNITFAVLSILLVSNTFLRFLVSYSILIFFISDSHRTNYSLINFEDYEENDKPLIDFINLGKLSLEDMIIDYAQTLYNILKELKKENEEYKDNSLIEKLELNHVRTNLKYDGITVKILLAKIYKMKS